MGTAGIGAKLSYFGVYLVTTPHPHPHPTPRLLGLRVCLHCRGSMSFVFYT